MKLIGIDIAIENLAFCCIDYSEDAKTTSITRDEWFVMDTTPEDYKQTCEYQNKKKCSKDAGWFYIDKESGLYRFYCAPHKKLVIGNDDTKKTWKTLNKNYLNSNEVIQSMFKKLDQKLELWRSADYIIIEKQPPKNPKMISVMNYIYSYFVIRLWNDVNKNNCHLKDIVFLDAKNKVTYCLDVLSKDEIDEIGKKYNPTKNKYQYYKKTSIATVQKELTSSGEKELLDYFNSYKKIDDLADSRNMVLWWLNREQKALTKKETKATKLAEKEAKLLSKEAKGLAKATKKNK
jgi:hypothetical protein